MSTNANTVFACFRKSESKRKRARQCYNNNNNHHHHHHHCCQYNKNLEKDREREFVR